ncbi:MAG TPA: tRNA (N6-threonylcarbamoyladenosine(37)-N6)-methyltransferase TrmO [Polyangiaceae bacterium]|nr:tRNA (N6-threonylcarbamoyladenosine(37)-N6)-methyltransferase TrmO [Polyangiaceae bacterium]
MTNSLFSDPRGQSFTVHPIGVVHSPFKERVDAPRQPTAARGVEATIELFDGHNFEQGLEDLSSFNFIWVVFWFHLNTTWKPKVSPPRSGLRRGVFATRAPYRPNPIGLSVVELLKIEGLTLSVQSMDMLDGTPVLDLKPYVPYVDSLPDANNGWLDAPSDPQPEYAVNFAPLAETELAFLSQRFALELRERFVAALKLGPEPQAFRRIRREGAGFVISVKDWRAAFIANESARSITVLEFQTAHRPRTLATVSDPALDAHRAFVAEFGSG